MMPHESPARGKKLVKVPKPNDMAALRFALLGWYGERARPLRFRGHADPWGVLVAEVMAQQTQVARVEPAWAAFVERFPSPDLLARASPAEVLRAWRGLGYNRRALLLQRAAAAMVERHAGRVPSTLAELLALPGIGPYTARAVLAIAFQQPEAPVDTNVRRVLGRIHGGGQARPAEMQALADDLVDRDRPAAWTQALMDLGATLCGARVARCEPCPLRPWCASAGQVGEARGSVPATARASGPRFESTSRWLRGRIVDRLRDEGAGWHRVEGPIGEHPGAAVERALAALEREGLLERRADGAARLPSGRS
jgi:A/G-specific adenine glycosylase